MKIKVLDRSVMLGNMSDLHGMTPEEVANYFHSIHKDYEKETFNQGHEVKMRFIYGYGDIELEIFRLETDREFEKRVAKIKREAEKEAREKELQAKKKEGAEYKTFLRLKKKFEGSEK
jgi:hypothetical protein